MCELNWDFATTCDWLLQKCWEHHECHPGGGDLFLTPENLGPQDPPFDQICKVAEYLQGKALLVVEFGRAFGQELPIFAKIKLAPKAIADFRDMLKLKQKTQAGFFADGQVQEREEGVEDERNQ